MRRRFCLATIVAGAVALSSLYVAAQSRPPDGGFVESDIPAPAATPDLFDLLAAGETSPRGAAAGSVDPRRTYAEGKAFIEGKDGHPKDAKEGVFWLRRAVASGDAISRVNAIALLGLQYANGNGVSSDREAAKQLWQIAGAMGSGGALYNLGQLAEIEAKGNKNAEDAARTWYTRAQQAGYDPDRTAAAIARLGK